MACKSIALSGIGLGCKDHMGGIKELYLIDEASVGAITYDADGKKITAINILDDAKFKTYRFRKGTSSMTSTMSTDEAAGTLSVETAIELQFSKMETSKRLEIMAMCLGSMKGIVLDNNGVYWFIGIDNPISATAATGVTGTAFTDFGGYTVTLTDNSKEFPFEIDKEALADLIQAAPLA